MFLPILSPFHLRKPYNPSPAYSPPQPLVSVHTHTLITLFPSISGFAMSKPEYNSCLLFRLQRTAKPRQPADRRLYRQACPFFISFFFLFKASDLHVLKGPLTAYL